MWVMLVTRTHRHQQEAVIATARPGGAAREHVPGAVDSGEPWMRSLHSDTGYVLYRLGLRAGQLFNATLQESGLRLRHYALMRYLSTVPGALQRELSVHLGYDPSAIVGLVDDLERLDLVVRQPDPADRRSRVVVLTETGWAFLRDSDAAARRVTDELLGPLAPRERRTLHDLLLRMAFPERGDGLA